MRTPTLAKQAAKAACKLHLEGIEARRALAPPRSKKSVRNADSTVLKFNTKYFQGTAPRRRLVLRRKCRNSEIYFYFIKESI
ncbi:hypothetical protein MTR67_031096 [Solanum verrucosum]|uniref:Uncharacterized protein n=1 Tax=Solanum verrucosum TaxID=315347 RepID=A0AAF0ZD66_SOLVR|nr:hypothetical protein MTR67_031096 [Solanum verrucosum]